MKKSLSVLMGLLFLCSSVVFLNAGMGKDGMSCPTMGKKQMYQKMGGHRKGKSLASMLIYKAEKLELTDKQVEELRKLQKELKHYRVDKEGELDSVKMELTKLEKDDKGSLEDIKKAIFKIYTVKADLKYTQIESNRKALDILTKKQKAKLKEIKKEKKKKYKKW